MNNKIPIDLGLEDVEIRECNIDKKGVYHIKIQKQPNKFHGEPTIVPTQ